MSFSFGTTTTTAAGSAFGTTTPPTGFAFGSGDASKPLFGGTSTENKPAFNFTSPTTSTPAFGSFGFGGAKTSAPTSSLFSTPATTTAGSAFGASKPLGFTGFASPPNQTVGSPGFGQPANQNAPQNLSFGGTPQQQTTTPAFGTPTTQAPAFGSPANSGFAFGKPASTTGFGFTTPASGFSAPQQAAIVTSSTAPQTTQSSILGSTANFGTPQTTGLSFGQSSVGAKPASGFSFGGSASPAFGAAANAAPTFGTTAPASGFSVPQQPTAQPTNQPSLGFGTTSAGLSFGSTQPAAVASTAPSFGSTASSFQPPTGGLNFGTTSTNLTPGASTAQTGLSFGLTTATSTPQATTGLSFGTTPAATSQPATGLSFGKTAATTSQPPTGLGFSTTPASSASLPTSGINFGTTPASSATTTGLSFGTTPASSAPTTGLNFGTTSAPTTQPTTGLTFGTTSTASQPTTGLSFGVSTAPPAQATTALSFGLTSTASSAAPTSLSFGVTSAPAPTGLSFGTTSTSTGLSFTTPVSTVTSAVASTTAPSGITALGKSTAATTMPSLTATTTTTAAPVAPQVITSITFAELEENINKWTLELEEQERTFINQATQINAWDRLLIANGEKIVELNDAVQTVKNEQQSLEHELDFVLAQQKELEDLLAPMEKQLLGQDVDRVRDPEREHMYSLAENLDTQLRQMSEDLKEVIEHINETNRSQDSNDPIVQIGRILNTHMSSMQWIDNSIAQISTKLDQLKATHDTLRRDNERSFQLTYN